MEDVEVKRASRENEPDYHGKSLMYAVTCNVAKDILGRGVDDGCLHYK